MSVAEADKKVTIRDAVKELVHSWGAWEDEGVDSLTEDLVRLTNACAVKFLTANEVDETDQDLRNQAILWVRDWEAVREGTASVEGLPTSHFFAQVEKLNQMVIALEAPPDFVATLSIAEQLADMGDDPTRWEMIARDWGTYDTNKDMWTGPFWTNGVVNRRAIQAEVKDPGSVLGASHIHPSQAAKRASQTAEAEQVIREVSAARFRADDDVIIDPHSIEDLLREGQFPEQIAIIKGVSVDEVLAEAKRLGLEVTSAAAELEAALAANATEDDPQVSEAVALQAASQAENDGTTFDDELLEEALDAVSFDETVEVDDPTFDADLEADILEDEQPEDLKPMAKDALKELVGRLVERDIDTDTLAVLTEAARLGFSANARQIGGLLSHAKRVARDGQ